MNIQCFLPLGCYLYIEVTEPKSSRCRSSSLYNNVKFKNQSWQWKEWSWYDRAPNLHGLRINSEANSRNAQEQMSTWRVGYLQRFYVQSVWNIGPSHDPFQKLRGKKHGPSNFYFSLFFSEKCTTTQIFNLPPGSCCAPRQCWNL
jgi:hypothetical protein